MRINEELLERKNSVSDLKKIEKNGRVDSTTLVAAKVPSSPIFVTLTMEALRSSETSVLKIYTA
jgi:hypothetical protein